ncbi:hypothetical protein QA640_17940 [Bradyrhizobium sp. CB82]|uniref:hypothetical protein n=1 Tax=Bradyrhizobium sp. CB82 TaxID=3039159 RepID=UPI0024B15969|nr:hypothetical protein [Bradyrhizobium sp. CB82]WFU44161.1 hypothetical protein QA640_17940 [Bradyrhizobium sp. CB82]
MLRVVRLPLNIDNPDQAPVNGLVHRNGKMTRVKQGATALCSTFKRGFRGAPFWYRSPHALVVFSAWEDYRGLRWQTAFKLYLARRASDSGCTRSTAPSLWDMLIDRAEDFGDLDRVCDWLVDNPRLHIIIAARDLEWRNLNFPTDDPRFMHLFIDRLSREIDEAAKAMQKFRAADDLVSLDELKSRLLTSVQESRYQKVACSKRSEI